jgi:hypothetical protein
MHFERLEDRALFNAVVGDTPPTITPPVSAPPDIVRPVAAPPTDTPVVPVRPVTVTPPLTLTLPSH